MASPEAALAVEALEAAASTMVRQPPERRRVLPGPDRASATETSETFETFTIGSAIATSMMMISSSSVIRSFSVLRSFIRTDTGTILTGIIPTAIPLTDMIHMATGTAVTINPVTLGVRRADVPRLRKSSVV